MPYTTHLRTRTTVRLCGRVATVQSSGFHMFNSPGGDVLLNAEAVAILRLCDGTRSRDQITGLLAASRTHPQFPHFVRPFLVAALRYGWISEAKCSHVPAFETREKLPIARVARRIY